MALLPATTDNLRAAAYRWQPVFVYGRQERYFPVLPEAWLTHATAAAWERAPGDPEDLPVDPARRGTAVAVLSDTGPVRLGGTPNDSVPGRPVQLSAADDPDAIGAPAYAGDGDHFLVYGGWSADSLAAGDPEYLYRSFSELAAVMNPGHCAWQPTDGEPHLPHTWVPQPVTPTAIVEAEWCGVHVGGAGGDIPPVAAGAVHPLAGYLALTYHLLYPYRGPVPDGGAPRSLEGQWEAVTLFFAGDPANGRPTRFADVPSWIAVSKGVEDRVPQLRHVSEVRRFDDKGVERVDAAGNPFVYVGTNTHRNHFSPAETTTPSKPGTGPGQGINYDAPFEVPGVEGLLAGALAAAAAAIAAGVLANIGLLLGFSLLGVGIAILAAALVVVAALLVAAWLLSAGVDARNQNTGSRGPSDSWGGQDEAPRTAPVAAAAYAPPGTTPGGRGSFTAEPGGPNHGESEGRDVVAMDLRLVDRLNPPADVTPYPSPSPNELPAWWGFTGHWGIRVRQGVGAAWDDGMRRVDALGRSWAYWHAVELCKHL